MAVNRRELIRKIILEQPIENQHQLRQALATYGVSCTQPTLSREIKAMRIVKRSDPDGRYRYMLSPSSDENVRQRLKTILHESVVSVDRAQNLIVIKTLPELASAACAVFDGMQIDHLVGTIAGDNTAFLAMRDNDSAEELYQDIEKIIYED